MQLDISRVQVVGPDSSHLDPNEEGLSRAEVGFWKNRVFWGKFRMYSGVVRVARGGSGVKAPPLAARPVPGTGEARAETGGADQWALKRRECSGFARVNEVISASWG